MRQALPAIVLIFFLPLLLLAQRPSKPRPIKGLPDRPKLVIGIVVDQMRYDFCQRYLGTYSEKGFKRLMQSGFSFSNCQYSYFPTITGPGHASVFTGTTPWIHGIVGNNWFDKKTGGFMYCTRDDSVQGIGSSETEALMSPKNMQSYSVADQVKLSCGGKSFGISVKDRGAILPAGHGADAAFWFEAKSGNFISSNWYHSLKGRLPSWLEKFNNQGIARSYRDSVWNLLKPAQSYSASTGDNKDYEKSILKGQDPVFPYALSRDNSPGFEIVRRTPFGNSLTARLAKVLIENEGLGLDEKTDFLSLSFSCTDIVGHDYGPNSMEVQDTYLRLDRDLGEFFDFMDARIGSENYLVFLTADHGILEVPEFLNEKRLPSQRFQGEVFLSGLKAYCRQIFGSDDIIKAFENLQIYLNEEEITRLNLERSSVCEKIVSYAQGQPMVFRAFAFSGQRPFPDAALLEKYEQGWFRGRSGDIQIVLPPGILDSERKKGTSHGSPYSYDSHVPLLWMGWKVKQGETAELIHIEDIAPTLSHLLRIMEPNGCTGKARKIPIQ